VRNWLDPAEQSAMESVCAGSLPGLEIPLPALLVLEPLRVRVLFAFAELFVPVASALLFAGLLLLAPAAPALLADSDPLSCSGHAEAMALGTVRPSAPAAASAPRTFGAVRRFLGDSVIGRVSPL
jgi:hypothetical protein